MDPDKGEIELRIVRIPIAGCWIWMAGISNGYGHVRVGEITTRAHRVVYEIYKGPIPWSQDVLHTCGVRCCVNPEHLYLGTDIENAYDTLRQGRNANTNKTHCPYGHPLFGSNLGVYKRQRYCKECKRANYRSWYAKTGRPNR